MPFMKTRGFSLVELVMIITIIGVLAVAVVPRFFERQPFEARSYFDQTKGMLRYAQKVAIAQNRPVFVRLDGASIALCFINTCTAGNRVAPPAGQNSGSAATLAACANDASWFCEAPPSGVTISALAMFYFSSLGKPYMPADTIPTSSFGAGTVTIGGETPHDITIEQETGYVH